MRWLGALAVFALTLGPLEAQQLSVQLTDLEPPPQTPEQRAMLQILRPAWTMPYTSVGLLVQRSCDSDRARGAMDASTMHGSGGRFAGGFALGFTLGLIGTGIAWGIASGSEPQPRSIPDEINGEPVDQACYRMGYVNKAKSKNKSSAGLGGLLGTALIVTIAVAATS